MKTVIFLTLIILLVLIVGCSNTSDFELEQRKITDLLNQNAECYRNKNLDCIMETYLKDSSVIALGTERNFVGKGYEEIYKIYKSDLSQGWEMTTYEYKNPMINVDGNVAWLTADVFSEIKVNIRGNDFNIKLDSRLTAVCKKVDDEWKFVLTNFQHFKNPADALNFGQGEMENEK